MQIETIFKSPFILLFFLQLCMEDYNFIMLNVCWITFLWHDMLYFQGL